MTLYKVIETIKMLALKHPNVNGAYEGNIYDIMNANPKQKYASVVLTQQSHTQDNTYDHYNFNIFYVDRLVDDMEVNRVQIQSTGKSILSNIIKAFCEEFDGECENITFNTFTERFADECAGVYCTITIDMLKDIYCTEKYWDGNWSAPVLSIKNQNKKVEFTENGNYTISYDNENFTGLGTVEVEVNIPDTNGGYEEGYLDGKTDGYTDGLADGIGEGISHQKSLLESITITENGIYNKEDGYNHIEVNVPDVNGSYEDGYNDGIEEQKSKLESVTITENGTYTKEDGYNQITVNVPDVNGSYDEGYNDGIKEGVENAGELISENAQVLNITENGTYKTIFSKDEDIQVTGYFADGTPFYGYTQLIDKSLKTDVNLRNDSRVELWWRPDLDISLEGNSVTTILSLKKDTYSNNIIICYNTKDANSNSEKITLSFNSNYFTHNKNITDKWYHIVMSINEGFFVDGEKITDLRNFLSWDLSKDFIYINDPSNTNQSSNGYFGMIKIDNNIYIPTENGFVNYETNTPLEVINDGSYFFYNKLKYNGENFIRTVNVNIKQKVSLVKTGLKFAETSFSEIPEWADFEGLTDMSYMFYECKNLETIPQLDTSNVTNMSYMFRACDNLETIPQLDTSKVTNMSYMFYTCSKLKNIPQLDTSKVTNMTAMFYSCSNLETIPQLDTSKVTNMTTMFYYCTNLKSLPPLNVEKVTNFSNLFGYSSVNNLTDLGGFIGLKNNWNDNYGLRMLPNLTYESCINVLNGLYDFTGNNETPTNSQGKLKVHANFLTTVGDEISIGTNKGWTITA